MADRKIEYGPTDVPVVSSPHEVPFVDRRKRKDWVTFFIQVFSIISWILIAFALLFVQIAQPESLTIIDVRRGKELTQVAWNYRYLLFSFILFAVTFAVCAFGTIFNIKRHKRKTDKYRVSLFVLGGGSLIGAIVMAVILYTQML